MNRFLLAIGGLMVGLLAVLFAAPTMVDWNKYRGVFEEEASRLLGREVRVDGEVNLRLLPVPFVRFGGIRIADTVANVGKPLFAADDLTVWLSVGGLLAGRVEASAVELRKPVVTLVLDGKGGGNWSSLAEHSWPASIVPASIAFDSVRITGGRVDVLSSAGASRAAFEHINGELSAAAIEGPYKVTAAYAVGGSPRELRLSTAKPGDDGAIRLKATVRDPAKGVSYNLDGSLRDVLAKTKLTGELTARLPLPSVLEGEASRRRSASDFDVRAQVEADTAGLLLKDMAVSFEQGGRPQLASGQARVAWAETTETEFSLKSHWLDLDRIADGSEAEVSPLRLVQTLAVAVGKVLDTEGRTTATIAIEQATLGGDAVSGLEATMEQAQGKLLVRSLSAALPGGARIAATGSFDLKGAEPRYDGRVNLRGASLGRFLGWAARGQGVRPPSRDGSFSLTGDMTLASNAVAGRNLSLQVGRNALAGEASWQAGKGPEIAVNLEGSELDLTPFVDPTQAPLASLRAAIDRLSGKDHAGSPGGAGGSADVKLRVDKLVAGGTTFRDAIVDVRLSGESLSVARLKLNAEDGYELELRADIAAPGQPTAKGEMTGSARADRVAGIAALARLLGASPDIVTPIASPAAVPMRIAGRAQLGIRGPSSLELALDGAVGTSRVAGTARLGGETASWRERQADVALTLEGPDVAGLIAGLAHAAGDAAPTVGAGPSRVTFRGIGTARGGLSSLIAVASDALTADYRGLVSIDDTGSIALDGGLDISAKDLARSLAFAGVQAPPGLGGPAGGKVAISRKGPQTTIASEAFAVAGTSASGRISVEPGPAGSRRVGGEIKLEGASLPKLLAALTAGRTRGPPAEDSNSPWSEAALDLSAFDAFAGSKLRIDVARLSLSPAVIAGDAKLELGVRADGVDVKLEQAKALGGQASGRLTLEKAPAGARLVTDVHVYGARLEALAATPAAAAAAGGLSVSIKGQSVALTPRGLIVGLAGSGEAALERAQLRRWSPTAVGVAAEAIVTMKGEIPPDALRQQLELALEKGGGVPLGSPRLALTLADGAVRAAPLTVNAPKGRLQGRFAIDLDLQRFDGEWRIEPKGTAQIGDLPAKGELPAIAVVFAGPLSAFDTMKAHIDMEALEREVAVRKVEREVAELERLRREDEERARQEALRQEEERKLAEQQRLQALQAPAAPIAGGAPPQGEPAPGSAAPGAAGTVAPGASGQGTTGAVAPGAAPETAVPPSTVEVTPLTRPAQRPKPPRVPVRPNPSRPISGG